MEEVQEEGGILGFLSLLQVLKKQFYIFIFLKFHIKVFGKNKQDSTPKIV